MNWNNDETRARWRRVPANFHYNDVMMSAVASLITSLTVVYSSVYSGANQRKHQSSASLAFMRGIHRWPVNYPHKGPVVRKMFSFDDVIMLTANIKASCVMHDINYGLRHNSFFQIMRNRQILLWKQTTLIFSAYSLWIGLVTDASCCMNAFSLCLVIMFKGLPGAKSLTCMKMKIPVVHMSNIILDCWNLGLPFMYCERGLNELW